MEKNLYISKSNIHGQSVFSNKPFKQGDVVFIMKGKRRKFKIRTKEDSRRFDSLAPRVANWIGIDKDTWMDPQDGFSTVLNHSCNPNLGIKGRLTFYRYIILNDFNFYVDEEAFQEALLEE